jgi:S-(hydroxymethyl)glutathione dehydrogenase/alcohol dehydrogenase
VEIDFLSLLFGGNVKGSIFGGIKARSDFPVIIDKWKKKVNFYEK